MTLLQEIRFGFRMLRKNPGFTALAVGVLALGIGVNSATFNLVNSLMLRPLAVHEPERIVGCYSKDIETPDDFRSFSYLNYRDLREAQAGFSDLAAHRPTLAGLKEGEATRRIMATLVSSNYFTTFGLSPVLGRDFTPEEESPYSHMRVAIASFQLWQRNGGGPEFLGRALEINGKRFTVVGIAPRDFTGTIAILSPDVWLPLGVEDEIAVSFGAQQARPMDDRRNHRLMLIGRMEPGLEIEQLNQRLAVVSARLESDFPDVNKNQLLVAHTLSRVSISTSPRDDTGLAAFSVLLLGMSGIVLLIASLNLANMQAARISARRHEFAVRLALGSGLNRVVRQLLVEGLLLSSFAGALGLIVAYWAPTLLVSSLIRMLPFNVVFRLDPDWRVLAATLGFSLASALLFTLGPVWKLRRHDPMSDLRDQKASQLGAAGGRILGRRNVPVLAEIALSMVLLTVGGLFARGAFEAITLNPGFPLQGGLLVELDAGLLGYEEPTVRALYQDIQARVRALPGVGSASLAATVPFGTVSLGRSVYRAADLAAGREDSVQPVLAGFNIVGSDYFSAMAIPLLQGREFSLAEDHVGHRSDVAVIDEKLAQQLWPGENVVGRRIAFPKTSSQPAQELEVVGLSSSISTTLLDPDDDDARIYVPFGWAYRANMNLHVRTAAGFSVDPAQLLVQVRDEIRKIDPHLPILSLKTLEHHMDESAELWAVRAGAYLFTGIGLLALLLSSIGVYGVRAYSVARRTHEIGIRVALGANVRGILGLVLGEGVKLTALGLLAGLALAIPISRLLTVFLYQVSASDPAVFGLSALVLSIVVLLACYLPARRASRVDPMVALRCE